MSAADIFRRALLALPYITEPAEARRALAQAAMAGADIDACREAWATWQAMRDDDVTTIRSET